jgi:hypothetical protein
LDFKNLQTSHSVESIQTLEIRLSLNFENVAHCKPDGSVWDVAGDATVSYADFVHVTMEYDAVLSITANGVTLLD